MAPRFPWRSPGFAVLVALLTGLLASRPALARPAAPASQPRSAARPGPAAPAALAPGGRAAAAARDAAAPTAASQPVPRPPLDPAEARRRAELRARILAILESPPIDRMRFGVQVLRPDGEVIYSHRADGLYEAASNTKIFTTGAALTLLGGGFQLRTTLVGRPPDDHGVVRGDLAVRGAGDPFLAGAHLRELAKRLRARGVRQVTGSVVADESRHGTEPGRGTGRLTLDGSTFRVVVAPGPRARKRPRVSVTPKLSHYFRVVNRAITTRRGRLRLSVTTRDQGARTLVVVSGRIPLRHRPVTIVRNPRHSSLFVAHSLRALLADQGITVRGGARVGRAPRGAEVLAEHRSMPLQAIIRPVNKNSNNFLAERVFQTTGAEIYGGPATSAKGTRAVAEFLRRLGFEKTAGRWRQVDGSGLSHSNRMSPAFVAEVLRRLLTGAPRVWDDFFPSLAVGGRDGTIRHRFRGGSAEGQVFGKTGTLRGVSALSGFVRFNGRMLVFSMLVNQIRGRSLKLARQAQNDVVMALYRYLVGDAAATRPVVEPVPADMEREPHEPEEPVYDESREITDENLPATQPAPERLPYPEVRPPESTPRLAPPALTPPPRPEVPAGLRPAPGRSSAPPASPPAAGPRSPASRAPRSAAGPPPSVPRRPAPAAGPRDSAPRAEPPAAGPRSRTRRAAAADGAKKRTVRAATTRRTKRAAAAARTRKRAAAAGRTRTRAGAATVRGKKHPAGAAAGRSRKRAAAAATARGKKHPAETAADQPRTRAAGAATARGKKHPAGTGADRTTTRGSAPAARPRTPPAAATP